MSGRSFIKIDANKNQPHESQTLPVFPTNYCSRKRRKLFNPEPGHWTSSGDAGGPMSCKANGKYFIVGLTALDMNVEQKSYLLV